MIHTEWTVDYKISEQHIYCTDDKHVDKDLQIQFLVVVVLYSSVFSGD
jgi:hypothetical protein